jgi:hypothetical protein
MISQDGILALNAISISKILLFSFFVCIVLLFEQNHFDNPRPQLVVTDLELFYPFTEMAWRK